MSVGDITGVVTIAAVADDEESSTAPATIVLLATVYESYVLTATDPAWNNVITITTFDAAAAPRYLAEIAADGLSPLSFGVVGGGLPSYLRLTSDAGKSRLQLVSPPQNPGTAGLTLSVRESGGQSRHLLLSLTLAITDPPPLTISVLQKPPTHLVANRGEAIGGIYGGGGGWLAGGRADYHFSVGLSYGRGAPQWARDASDGSDARIVNGTVFLDVQWGFPADVEVIMDDDHPATPPATLSFTVQYKSRLWFGFAGSHGRGHITITSDVENQYLGLLWAGRRDRQNPSAEIINSPGYFTVTAISLDSVLLGTIIQNAAVTDPPGTSVVMTVLFKNGDIDLPQTGTAFVTVEVRAPPVSITVANQPANAGRGAVSSVGVVSVLRGYRGAGFSFSGGAPGAAGAEVMIDNAGVIFLRLPPSQDGFVTITVSADDIYDYTSPGLASMTISVADPPEALVVSNVFAVSVIPANWLSPFGELSVGGHLGAAVSLSAAVDGASIGFDGLTILVSASRRGTLTATIVADDDAVRIEPGTLVITIVAGPPNDDLRVIGTVTAGITATVTLGVSVPSGGFLPYRYSLAAPRDDIVLAPFGNGGAHVVFRGSAHAPGVLTATAVVRDSRNQRANMLLRADFVRAPSLSIFAVAINGGVETGAESWAATLSSSGGYGAHTLFLPAGQTLFRIDSGSVLLVSSSSPVTASATIYIDDENDYTYRHLTIMAVTVLDPVSIAPPPLLTLKTRASLIVGEAFATLTAFGGHPGDDGYVFGITNNGGYAGVNATAGSVLVWQRSTVQEAQGTVELSLYATDKSASPRQALATMSLHLVHPTVSLSVVRLLSVAATGVIATVAGGVLSEGSGDGYSLVVIGASGASLSAGVLDYSTLLIKGVSLGSATVIVEGRDNHPDSIGATSSVAIRLSGLLRLPPPLDALATATIGHQKILATLRAANTTGIPSFAVSNAPPVVSVDENSGVLSFLPLPHLPGTIVLTLQVADEEHSVADLHRKAFAFMTIAIVPPPVSLLVLPFADIIPGTVTAAVVSATGGYVSVGGSYVYDAAGDGVSVNADGGVIVITDAPKTITATVFADDTHHYTPQASIVLTFAAPDKLTLLPASMFVTTGIAITSQLLGLQLLLGTPPYSYVLASALPPYMRFDNVAGVFGIAGKPPDAPQSFSVIVSVSDSSPVQRRAAATISVVVGHPPPLSHAFGGDAIVTAGGDAARVVFSVFGGALSAGAHYDINPSFSQRQTKGGTLNP